MNEVSNHGKSTLILSSLYLTKQKIIHVLRMQHDDDSNILLRLYFKYC